MPIAGFVQDNIMPSVSVKFHDLSVKHVNKEPNQNVQLSPEMWPPLPQKLQQVLFFCQNRLSFRFRSKSRGFSRAGGRITRNFSR